MISKKTADQIKENQNRVDTLENKKRNYAKVAFVLAIVFWLASLAFPGLITYKEDSLIGLQILSVGWLGPLTGNFSWYANILFFIGLFRVVSGKSTEILLFIAIILVLSTFTLGNFSSGLESSDTVYGYGFGFILWTLSFFLLQLASWFKLEFDISKDWLVSIPAICIASFIIMTVYFSVSDRLKGNEDELDYFSKNDVVFKRGPICSETVNQPKYTFTTDKPIEIININNTGSSWPLFSTPGKLLRWGFPVIRMNGIDYFNASNDDFILAGKPASDEAGSIIKVTNNYIEKYKAYSRAIFIASNDFPEKNISQSWLPIIKGKNITCPKQSSYPKPDEQPLKLLSEVFKVDVNNHKESNQNKSKRIKSVIESTSSEKYIGIKIDKYLNYNCIDNVGFMNRLEWHNMNKPYISLPAPFKLNGILYFADNTNKAICKENSVYVYTVRSRKRKESSDVNFTITKRSLVDYSEYWRISSHTRIPENDSQRYNYVIKSISDNTDSIRIQLFDLLSATTIDVSSDLTITN